MAPSSRVSLDILLISKEPKYASGFKHDSVDGDSTAFDGHSQDRFIYKKPIGDIGQDMQNRPNTHVRYSDTHNHPILASAPAPAPAPVPAPTSASTSTLAEARLPECPPPFPTHRYNCDNSCNKYHSQHALPSWRQPSLLDQAYKNSSSPPLIHRHTEASGHSRDHGHPTQQNHTYYVANNDVYCAARDSKQQKQQNSDDYSRHRYHHQYTHKPYWQPMQSQQCHSEELGSSSSMSTSHQALLSKNMTSSCLSSSYDRLSTEQYELSLDYPNTHENGSSVADISIRPPSKRRKRHHNIASKVRSVQPVSRDKDGNYEMPVQVGILTVLCLGSIVWDRDAYHNERYIWPAGYTVQREYYSMKDPDKSVIYTCWITDGGDAPLFHVEAEDMTGEPIVSPTATGAWTSVLRTVNQIRHREHSNSASGPDYFGFSHPTIAKMIQDLPGADRCRSYIMQRFVEMKERHVRGVIKKGRGGRPSMEMLSRGQRALMASSSLPASARDAVAVRSPDSSRSEAGKQMSVEALTNSDCTAVSSTV